MSSRDYETNSLVFSRVSQIVFQRKLVFLLKEKKKSYKNMHHSFTQLFDFEPSQSIINAYIQLLIFDVVM